MLYLSPEAKLLRLLGKVYNRVPGVFERFVTDDAFDVEKAKDVFADRGINRTRLQTAVQAIVGDGFANSNGITAAGIAKIASIEAERLLEIQRLSLQDFFSGVTGRFDQAAMDELNAKDY